MNPSFTHITVAPVKYKYKWLFYSSLGLIFCRLYLCLFFFRNFILKICEVFRFTECYSIFLGFLADGTPDGPATCQSDSTTQTLSGDFVDFFPLVFCLFCFCFPFELLYFCLPFEPPFSLCSTIVQRYNALALNYFAQCDFCFLCCLYILQNFFTSLLQEIFLIIAYLFT